MPVQQPRRNQDRRALLHRLVTDALRLRRLAHEEPDRRIQPQRLAKHIADRRQALDIAQLEIAFTDRLLDLRKHLVLQVRALRDQVKRPRQRAGRRLVAGQEQHAHLVDQLFIGEAVAIDRIDRVHHAGEDVLLCAPLPAVTLGQSPRDDL
ncbi:hypothetical protein D9M71_579110 [compost metagenome]